MLFRSGLYQNKRLKLILKTCTKNTVLPYLGKYHSTARYFVTYLIYSSATPMRVLLTALHSAIPRVAAARAPAVITATRTTYGQILYLRQDITGF